MACNTLHIRCLTGCSSWGSTTARTRSRRHLQSWKNIKATGKCNLWFSDGLPQSLMSLLGVEWTSPSALMEAQLDGDGDPQSAEQYSRNVALSYANRAVIYSEIQRWEPGNDPLHKQAYTVRGLETCRPSGCSF